MCVWKMISKVQLCVLKLVFIQVFVYISDHYHKSSLQQLSWLNPQCYLCIVEKEPTNNLSFHFLKKCGVLTISE